MSSPKPPTGAGRTSRTRKTTGETGAETAAQAAATPAKPTTTTRRTTTRTPRATASTAATGASAKATASAQAVAQTSATPQKRRQVKTGRVVSDKMQKTIVVAVEDLKRHRIYKRTYKSTQRFKAHDEHNDAHIGDIVRIEETRPLSKDKRWRLIEITRQAVQTRPVEEVVAELDPTLEAEEE